MIRLMARPMDWLPRNEAYGPPSEPLRQLLLFDPADSRLHWLATAPGLYTSALQQPRAPALSISMTTEKFGFRPIEPEADLDKAEPSSILYGAPAGAMQPDQDYRLLEHSYRNSPEYAAMVERYPLLRSLISACVSSELVGHPLVIACVEHPTLTLQWDRSHGE